MLKKKSNKLLVCFLLSFALMIITVIGPQNLIAHSEPLDNYESITANGTWYESQIGSDSQYFKFVLASDGVLSTKVIRYTRSSLLILNSDLEKVDCVVDGYGAEPTENNPVTTSSDLILSKGTYYVKTEQHNNNEGRLKFQLKFSSFGTNESEPNDLSSPMKLVENKTVTACHTEQDDMDWFTFDVPLKTSVLIKAIKYNKSYITLYNSDFEEIAIIDAYYGYNATNESPFTKQLEIELDKGKYYIKAEKGNNGKYKIVWQIKYTPKTPSSLKVSTRGTKDLKLTWSKTNNVSGYQLYQKKNDTWKLIKTTTSTSHSITGLKSGVKYEFRVRSYKTINKTNYYSGYRTLSTATKPATPSIKTPSTNKKHQIIAKWSKVSAGTGYQIQYSKNKKFTSGVSKKTVSGITKTSYIGKNFSKGKTYYIRVRSYKTVDGTKYYSGWSKIKYIKCK